MPCDELPLPPLLECDGKEVELWYDGDCFEVLREGPQHLDDLVVRAVVVEEKGEEQAGADQVAHSEAVELLIVGSLCGVEGRWWGRG